MYLWVSECVKAYTPQWLVAGNWEKGANNNGVRQARVESIISGLLNYLNAGHNTYSHTPHSTVGCCCGRRQCGKDERKMAEEEEKEVNNLEYQIDSEHVCVCVVNSHDSVWLCALAYVFEL